MTVPNILSMFRILLVPVFIFTVLSETPYAFLYGMGVFLIAGLTDILDGRIARKYNCVSVLGKILDPLADKMMVASALICASIEDLIPGFIPVVFVAKEIFQCIGGLLFYKKMDDMIPSNILGKITTVVFYITIVCMFIFPEMDETIKTVLLAICVILLAVTVVYYSYKAIKTVAKTKEQ